MIQLDGHSFTIQMLWDIAQNKTPCTIDPEAYSGIQKSREFVEKLSLEPRAVYGINSGFGPLANMRVSQDEQEQHQINLLHHLSVGQGDLFSPAETRAIMVARANALIRGYSGIRREVIELLLNSVNHNILPEIPSEGSVGASGDLVPLAHMSRFMIGLGNVRVNGKRIPAKEALAEKKLKPVTLKCKEGLALVNGTSVMTALMGLAAVEASQLMGWLEYLTACLFQVLFGEPEALCGQLHRARAHRGQFAAAETITEYLRSHPKYAKEIDEHNWGTQHHKPVDSGIDIQDPYSLRCTPQIIGAVQDAWWHAEYVINRELNSSTDNPLIFAETETVIHGGNFYGQQISMVSDYLRIGLIKLALLSERQLERIMNWRYSLGLPPLLTGGKPGLHSGMAGCQLLATSLAAEARILATPASVQTIPTNANNQDVVSMGTISARMTVKTTEILWKLIAVQSLALVQAADLRKDDTVMGESFKEFHKQIRSFSPHLKEDRPLFEEIKETISFLKSEDAQKTFLKDRPESPYSVQKNK